MDRDKPSKMWLFDLRSTSQLQAQFNPTELQETIAVNWNKLAVLGFSHMPQQYQQTDNHGFSFELAFRAIDADGNRLDDLTYARKFLLSICYPSRSSPSPARVLFVWPKLVSLTSVVRKLEFKHAQFNRAGDPVVTSAKLTLEEIRDVRLYAEDVLDVGTQRSAGGT